MRYFLSAALCLLFLFVSASPNKASFSDNYNKKLEEHRLPARTLIGSASWYGYPFHGRITANGEVYNMHDLTAAHKSLPFGTLLRVTNLSNNKSLFVRVNDRGPYVNGRILDLSYAAAQQLGMVKRGVGKVKIDIYPVAKKKPLVAKK